MAAAEVEEVQEAEEGVVREGDDPLVALARASQASTIVRPIHHVLRDLHEHTHKNTRTHTYTS